MANINDLDHPENDDLTFDEIMEILEEQLLASEEEIQELDFND